MRSFFAPVLAVALGVSAAAIVSFSGGEATAKTSYDSLYGFDRTWNAAIRMVRVDMGLKLLEKDDTTGYLLFEYKSTEGGTKTSSGSMEFIRSRESDAPVRVVVQLPAMPRYHEQIMVDTLVRKMRNEYGDPPMHRPSEPKDLPKDAGTPDAEEP